MTKPKLIAHGAEAKIILVYSSHNSKLSTKKFFSLTKSSRKSMTKSALKPSISEQSEDKFIIKDRIKKSYRIPELDEKIRKLRTRSETKLLEKASKLIPVPKIIKSDEKTKKIIMQFIEGKKLSEHLDNFSLKKQKQICRQIGENVAKLHEQNIIHGDLTTSNMILVENLPAHSRSQINEESINKKQDKIDKTQYNKNSFSLNKSLAKKSGKADLGAINNRTSDNERGKFQIYFIDFGLGFISHKFEDKAVDIHLLKQALEAKHFKHWETLFNEFEKDYKKYKDSKIVLERLKAVERRGRYKH